MRPDLLIIGFRRILAFLAPSFGMTVLVFLRTRFGPRALGLKHLVCGGLTLFWLAFHVEPDDERDTARLRHWAEETIQQCHDDVRGTLYGGWSCADHLALAHARLARLPDTLPYMQYLLLAFLVVCAGQIWIARTRDRGAYASVYSYSDGVPLLSSLTFGRAPTLSKIILEPALVALVAWYFEARMEHDGTALYFGMVAVYLAVSGYQRWAAEFAGLNDLRDFWRSIGMGQGSMMRQPTRPIQDGILGRMLHTRERAHAEGLTRLRAFSALNRARMLEGIEEPRPVVPPSSSRESAFRAAPAPDAQASSPSGVVLSEPGQREPEASSPTRALR
jgi:hypothetical protein